MKHLIAISLVFQCVLLFVEALKPEAPDQPSNNCAGKCIWFSSIELEASNEEVCYTENGCYQLPENGGTFGKCDTDIGGVQCIRIPEDPPCKVNGENGVGSLPGDCPMAKNKFGDEYMSYCYAGGSCLAYPSCIERSLYPNITATDSQYPCNSIPSCPCRMTRLDHGCIDFAVKCADKWKDFFCS